MARTPGRAATKAAAKQEARKIERTLVLAGRTTDPEGKFVGYDGERMRYAGQKFYWYGLPLPSWVRIQNEDGEWVDAKEPIGRARHATAPVRRAAPSTLPGQAPKERIRELVDDDLAATRGIAPDGDLVIEPELAPDTKEPETGTAPARASDRQVG